MPVVLGAAFAFQPGRQPAILPRIRETPLSGPPALESETGTYADVAYSLPVLDLVALVPDRDLYQEGQDDVVLLFLDVAARPVERTLAIVQNDVSRREAGAMRLLGPGSKRESAGSGRNAPG